MKYMNFKTAKSFAVTMGLTLALSLGAASITNAASAATGSQASSVQPTAALQAVKSIPMLTRPWSWQPIDNRTVILWATPFRPYLVKLAFPIHELPWTQVIGVTSFGDRIYAKFDSVQVHGFRYPIKSIYKLTREEAKNWGRT